MICCKIHADGTALAKVLPGVIDGLSAKGDILWMDHTLYFANVDDPSVSSAMVARTLKKNGCARFLVEEFGATNQPRESESANAWLLGKMAQMAWNEAVVSHREELGRMAETLDALGADVSALAARIAAGRRDADGKNEER